MALSSPPAKRTYFEDTPTPTRVRDVVRLKARKEFDVDIEGHKEVSGCHINASANPGRRVQLFPLATDIESQPAVRIAVLFVAAPTDRYPVERDAEGKKEHALLAKSISAGISQGALVIPNGRNLVDTLPPLT